MALNIGDKFKVVTTDKFFKERYIGKVFTVQKVNPNTLHVEDTHYGVEEDCPFVFFDYEIEPVATSPIKRVIYNNPATIILWNDGTKTIAKCQKGDTYDREKGFVIAYLKKMIGNTTFRDELTKWCPEFEGNKRTNKPLTTDELLKMDARHVWCNVIKDGEERSDLYACGWFRVHTQLEVLAPSNLTGVYHNLYNNGFTFKAYREKPIEK